MNATNGGPQTFNLDTTAPTVSGNHALPILAFVLIIAVFLLAIYSRKGRH